MPDSRGLEQLNLTAIAHIPLVHQGDDLSDVISRGLVSSGLKLQHDDVLVVAQKIVSKAEGRLVQLASVKPSKRAQEFATQMGRDPRVIELVLRESINIIRHNERVLITENRLGIIMANAGIDQSNVEAGTALLLPEDPDQSAQTLRAGLKKRWQVNLGVIVADSIGRAWRRGVIGHAIGVAGLPAVVDLRKQIDLYGRELKVTETGLADEIAAAATIVMGQAGEGVPGVIVRGIPHHDSESPATALLRPQQEDLFR